MGEYSKISLETPQRKLWPFGLLNLLDKNILKAFDIFCTCVLVKLLLVILVTPIFVANADDGGRKQ